MSWWLCIKDAKIDKHFFMWHQVCKALPVALCHNVHQPLEVHSCVLYQSSLLACSQTFFNYTFCTVFLNNQVSHQSCEVDNILYLSNVCLLSELSIQLSVMMCQFPTAFCTITHPHIHCTVHAHHPFNFLIVVHIPVHECSIIILLVNAPTYWCVYTCVKYKGNMYTTLLYRFSWACLVLVNLKWFGN